MKKEILLIGKVSILLIAMFVLDSCVSKSKYEAIVYSKDSLENIVDSMHTIINGLNKDIIGLNIDIDNLKSNLNKSQSDFKNANENYNQLKSKSGNDIQELLSKIEVLQSEKTKLENELGRTKDDLNRLTLKNSSLGNDLQELKNKLSERDAKMNTLKNKLSNALLGFKDKGLSVEVKNGKVYVSLSNQLLFSSGSTKIDEIGMNALRDLSVVLNENPDISVLVEGHTDNQAVTGGARFKDNWELSVLRATEVVKYLQEEGKVNPTRLTASGRSEYMPILEGSDTESRAKNRRIEVILTPNLQDIYDVLD